MAFFHMQIKNIVEPVYYGLINFLSTGFLILLKNFSLELYISKLKRFYIFKPRHPFGLGRISSIIFCCLSCFVFI